MNREEILKRFKEIGVIYNEPVTLTSGLKSTFYCNIKKAEGYPDILNGIADLIGEKLKPEENCIAVSGYGGLPLGAVVASKFNRKLVIVRENEKKWGLRGLIDGYVPTGKDSVVILDDVLTTGKSISRFIDLLAETNVKISKAIVVVQREKVELPIPYEFLFTIDEIK